MQFADYAMRERVLTSSIANAISGRPGTSGLLAFGWDLTDDGIDKIKRRHG
jgi:hypothetical protein